MHNVAPDIRENILTRLRHAKAARTNDSYSSALRSYLRAATLVQFSPFPITPEKLTLYAAVAHSHLGVSARSIPSYISGIQHFAKLQNSDTLAMVLSGNKQLDFKAGIVAKQELPIGRELLARLISTLDLSTHNGALAAAYMSISYAGWLRVNEVVETKAEHDVKWGDIALSVDTDDFLININSSKTNRFGPTEKVPFLATHDATCPSKHLLHYMNRLHPDQLHAESPVFLNSKGRPFSSKAALATVRAALTEVGEDPSLYGTHSFRIGAATDGALAGLSDQMLRRFGRWAPTSRVFQRYVRPSNAQLIQVARNAEITRLARAAVSATPTDSTANLNSSCQVPTTSTAIQKSSMRAARSLANPPSRRVQFPLGTKKE